MRSGKWRPFCLGPQYVKGQPVVKGFCCQWTRASTNWSCTCWMHYDNKTGQISLHHDYITGHFLITHLPNPIMHQTKYPTMHHFVAEICTFLLQNGSLWDMGLMHCGTCEIGPFQPWWLGGGHLEPCGHLLSHIEAKTKWKPFRRRYIQVHFLEWKCLNSV